MKKYCKIIRVIVHTQVSIFHVSLEHSDEYIQEGCLAHWLVKLTHDLLLVLSAWLDKVFIARCCLLCNMGFIFRIWILFSEGQLGFLVPLSMHRISISHFWFWLRNTNTTCLNEARTENSVIFGSALQSLGPGWSAPDFPQTQPRSSSQLKQPLSWRLGLGWLLPRFEKSAAAFRSYSNNGSLTSPVFGSHNGPLEALRKPPSQQWRVGALFPVLMQQHSWWPDAKGRGDKSHQF